MLPPMTLAWLADALASLDHPANARTADSENWRALRLVA
jgi:hypothetical protein